MSMSLHCLETNCWHFVCTKFRVFYNDSGTVSSFWRKQRNAFLPFLLTYCHSLQSTFDLTIFLNIVKYAQATHTSLGCIFSSVKDEIKFAYIIHISQYLPPLPFYHLASFSISTLNMIHPHTIKSTILWIVHNDNTLYNKTTICIHL